MKLHMLTWVALLVGMSSACATTGHSDFSNDTKAEIRPWSVIFGEPKPFEGTDGSLGTYSLIFDHEDWEGETFIEEDNLEANFVWGVRYKPLRPVTCEVAMTYPGNRFNPNEFNITRNIAEIQEELRDRDSYDRKEPLYPEPSKRRSVWKRSQG